MIVTNQGAALLCTDAQIQISGLFCLELTASLNPFNRVSTYYECSLVAVLKKIIMSL